MKCPRCQQENPPQAKFCLECGAPVNGVAPSPRSYADLNREVERLSRDLIESVEQQTATAEILRVISASPADLQPVFEAILGNARQLCGGFYSFLFLCSGEQLDLAATHNVPAEGLEALKRRYPVSITSDEAGLIARAVRERRLQHVGDIQSEPSIPEAARRASEAVGQRAGVAVPLLREGEPIGALTVSRQEARPFSERELALLEIFANQAVIAIENVRLFKELEARNRDLTESLDRQTATADILRAISQAQTDVQPVFEAIADSAMRLFGAWAATVARYDGELVSMVAARGGLPGSADAAKERFYPPHRPSSAPEQAVVTKMVQHVIDVETDASCSSEFRRHSAARGIRSFVAVPMVRGGDPRGMIVVGRAQPGGFSTVEIAVLQTFADQAVIAVENARLFAELQEKNRALSEAHAQVTEALEQQTATSEILGVISSSPTDFQPVFDTIVRNAVRVCGAFDAVLVLADGNEFVQRAHHGPIETVLGARYPLRGTVGGRAVLEARVIQVENIAEASDYPIGRGLAQRIGYRTTLSVPLLREEGAAIGAITIRRTEVAPFSHKHIALLQTFADQAVIAIENVRLFTELQTKNHALTQAHRRVTEALEQQTATSEILRTIAHAQTEVQPVFNTIVRSAARLCHASHAAVFLTDGRMVSNPANYGSAPEALAAARARFPRPVGMDTTAGMAILTRSVVHVPDSEEPSALEIVRQVGPTLGFRSVVTVPMLREGEAVGAILVARREAGRFSDAALELLKTFADQAVIAIENVRLFNELQARTGELTRSVSELRALGEVGQAISSTLDLQTVLSTIVARATQLSGTDAGVIYEYDEQREVFVPRATEHLEADIVETMLATPVRKGEGATGRLAEAQQPIQVPDILAAPAESRVRGALLRAGYRALLAVPLVRENHLLGGLTVIRKGTGAFAPEVIELLQTFATQSALAIQNARLFLEIEDKSRQLEAASQHKSEFLANMSHELRTPLNAVIGFSEVLIEGMFGEVNDKQAEYLRDIHKSGRHLLSLINDILDLSKIEAGRMDLEPTDFDLPGAIDNALTLVRERAGRRGISLGRVIDHRVAAIRGDERKVKQVLLNLLSNALKFTPEGGRVDVRAAVNGDLVEVSVADTGVGIAPEDQEAIFEEFRQVGIAAKRVEGTGLGLALSRKFIELHAGRIWVESQVGQGSTFTFTLPVRRDE